MPLGIGCTCMQCGPGDPAVALEYAFGYGVLTEDAYPWTYTTTGRFGVPLVHVALPDALPAYAHFDPHACGQVSSLNPLAAAPM